jgi:hypothetical protein
MTDEEVFRVMEECMNAVDALGRARAAGQDDES